MDFIIFSANLSIIDSSILPLWNIFVPASTRAYSIRCLTYFYVRLMSRYLKVFLALFLMCLLVMQKDMSMT